MGDAYAYKCRNCGYEEFFNQGHGHLVHPQSVKDYLTLKKKLFHYKTHGKILALSQVHPNLQIKATFQIYMCPDCRLLYDKAEVKVYDDEKTYHKSQFRCTHCNRRLKLTNIHRLKEAACPVCHSLEFGRDKQLHQLWG